MANHPPHDAAVRKILVVGGGSAGWMAASYLSRALGSAVTVELVESEDIGIVGVGEATIPPIREFLRMVGVDEAEFLRRTDATYKVGIEFVNWGAIGDRYLHAFGHVGSELDAIVPLHHWWLHGRSAGTSDYPEWQQVFLGRTAADENRFAIDDRPGSDLARLLPHAYHFDAISLGHYLKDIAQGRGVIRHEGTIESCNRHPETGLLTEVVLQDGRKLKADFFVDCTGFRSLLLGETMEVPFESWQSLLTCDRAWVAQTRSDESGLPPFTRATALETGWQWRIPLQSRIGNGHVFASEFSDEDEALARFLETLGEHPTTEPRLLKFRTGRRKNAWEGNVLGLGLAAGFLEPLESTSIHFVQSSLERFVQLFPSSPSPSKLAERFNSQTELEWLQVRDFLVAHYAVTQRRDSAFWRYCADLSLPDSLSEILALWDEAGSVAIDGGHLFQRSSWTSLLIGQNRLPKEAHALTGRVAPGAIASRLSEMTRTLAANGSRLPDHRRFLEDRMATDAKA